MIRQRIARRQDTRFICAACAFSLRTPSVSAAGGISSRHRWYSSAGAPLAKESGSRPDETSGAESSVSGSTTQTTAKPAFGRRLYGQPFGLRTKSLPGRGNVVPIAEPATPPRTLALDDDFLLPHELAARNSVPDREPKPPPRESSQPPAREPPPRSKLPLGVGFEPAPPTPRRSEHRRPQPNRLERPKGAPRPEWAQLSRRTNADGTDSGDFVSINRREATSSSGLAALSSKLSEDAPGPGGGIFGSSQPLRNVFGGDNKGGSADFWSKFAAEPSTAPRRTATFGTRSGDAPRSAPTGARDTDDDFMKSPVRILPSRSAARGVKDDSKRQGPARDRVPGSLPITEEDFFGQVPERPADVPRSKPAPRQRAAKSFTDFEPAEKPKNQSRLFPAEPPDLEEPPTEWIADAVPTQLPQLNPKEYELVEDKWSRRRERPEKAATKSKAPRPSRRRNDDDDEDYDEAAEERAEERRRRKAERKAMKEREEQARLAAEAAPKPILLPEFITIANLGDALGFKPQPFLEELTALGFEDITEESVMTGETAALVAQEFGFEPTIDDGDQVDLRPRPPPEDPYVLPPRPPIVTIMGHVDHGKTTMLDWLRKSSIAAGEHGGITQHIGAFSVRMSTGKQITFLDTPGHAAFLTMRQRGANITDIVILVVAADDSVKPQTLEALKHARHAKVPIVVAINKADKEQARVEQVKADLAKNGVEIEEYGGDVQVVAVSGKTGLGMTDLEEGIITLAEVLDMRAERDGMAEGWILESSIKPLGRAATVLVKRGTLRKGDVIVAGTVFAKVRSMLDESGQEVEEAPPGTPVEVFGWREAPSAGDQVLQAPDEDRARQAVRYRQERAAWEKTAAEVAAQERREREKAEADAMATELAELDDTGEESEGAEGAKTATGPVFVNFLVKGDVMGSVEAVNGAVMEIGNNEVRPRVLRSSPGQVNESDVDHAATTGSTIINFNNTIPAHIQRLAASSGVRILDQSVIYHLVDAVKQMLSERLPLAVSHKVLGEAEILQVFQINIKGRKYKNVAGCKVRNGQLTSGGLYRVLRGGKKIFDGKLESLKHGKKEITEAKKNSECGLGFDGFQDFQVGDQVQAYEVITEKRYL